MNLLPARLRPVKQARLARPRATRVFVTRRRAVLLSMFLVASAFPVGGHLMGLISGQDTAAAIAEVFRDPLAMIQGRSPGARGEGAMFQTKIKSTKQRLAAVDKAPVGPEGPVERVLPGLRERAPDLVTPPPVDTILPPDSPIGPQGGPDPLPQGDPGPSPPDLPPGSPPGPDGPCCGGPTVVPPDNPPVVPEPATWITMILGFGLVGSAIRRKTALARAVSAKA